MKNTIWRLLHNFELNKRTGRMISVFEDDIFLVSYPKSGNTWMRFLLANMREIDTPAEFANIEDRVPDIYSNSNSRLMNVPSPRILKSHECFDPRYRKVIYIVRDPRDVAVSYYFHSIKFKKILEDYPIAQFVDSFIAGKIDPYGTWFQNVGSWLYTRNGDRNFLLVRYEDLLDRGKTELHRIADFVDIDMNNENLDRVLTMSSRENMRKLEGEQASQWSSTRNSRLDRSFVRRGKAGEWRTELPLELAQEIQTEWGSLMKKFGYT